VNAAAGGLVGAAQARAEDLVERHRRPIPAIDAHVVLARQRLQSSMAVAVEVGRAPVLTVPGSERVMAKHEATPVELELGIIADARPAGGRGGRGLVVVAADKMLGPVEALQKPLRRVAAAREVAEVPNFVLLPHDRIPSFDEVRIHFRDRRERPLVNIDRTMIAEMGVAGEEHGHVRGNAANATRVRQRRRTTAGRLAGLPARLEWRRRANQSGLWSCP
jgi:hypothetical protein